MQQRRCSESTFDGFTHGALPGAPNTTRVHASTLRRLRREPDLIDRPSKAGNTIAPLSPSCSKTERPHEEMNGRAGITTSFPCLARFVVLNVR